MGDDALGTALIFMMPWEIARYWTLLLPKFAWQSRLIRCLANVLSVDCCRSSTGSRVCSTDQGDCIQIRSYSCGIDESIAAHGSWWDGKHIVLLSAWISSQERFACSRWIDVNDIWKMTCPLAMGFARGSLNCQHQSLLDGLVIVTQFVEHPRVCSMGIGIWLTEIAWRLFERCNVVCWIDVSSEIHTRMVDVFPFPDFAGWN